MATGKAGAFAKIRSVGGAGMAGGRGEHPPKPSAAPGACETQGPPGRGPAGEASQVDLDRMSAKVAVLEDRCAVLEGRLASDEVVDTNALLERVGTLEGRLNAIAKDVLENLCTDHDPENHTSNMLHAPGLVVLLDKMNHRLEALEGMASVSAEGIGKLEARIDRGLEDGQKIVEALTTQHKGESVMFSFGVLLSQLTEICYRLGQLERWTSLPKPEGDATTAAPVRGRSVSAQPPHGVGPAAEATSNLTPSGGVGPSGSAPPVLVGDVIESDTAHAWLMREVERLVASGRALDDCGRVAALEHLERQAPGVAEVWARLLAVGKRLEALVAEVGGEDFGVLVGGWGLDEVGYGELSSAQCRLREQWLAFEAGDRVPGLTRYRMDADSAEGSVA